MSTPHLTPKKLLGSDVLPPEWAAARVAFVCFTPFPNGFRPYVKQISQDRYFLHSPNEEVRLCQYQNIPFLVLGEIYGFPVGATTVEELVHHGIRYIIAVGYAGAFNDAPLGMPFIATETMSDLPIAVHYGIAEFVHCKPSNELLTLVTSCIKDEESDWGQFSVWTGNSLYRETAQVVQQMKDRGCDVVNMDTLSIYAATPVSARDAGREVDYIYVGTVTDSMEGKTKDWNSNLIEAVKRDSIHPHDNLVKFMVETVLSRLK